MDMSTMRNVLIDSNIFDENCEDPMNISVDGKNMSRSILSNSPSKLNFNSRRSDRTLKTHIDKLNE